MKHTKKLLALLLALALGLALLVPVGAVGAEPSAGLQAATSQWWEGLPGFVQSILRWLFFGWIWMKPITPPIQPLNPETVANNLMRAIETKDIDLFTEQLCLNIMQNVTDFPVQISMIFDVLDEEIIEVKWKKAGGYQESRGGGKSLKQTILHIDYTTSMGKYRLGGVLEYYNSFQPEEMGIRAILLTEYDPPYVPFVDLRATNGVGEWHD